MRKNILIVGATRHLGHSLATQYAKKNHAVYCTARYSAPMMHIPGTHWIPNVDITHEVAGRRIAAHWEEETKVDLLIIAAGSSSYTPESLDEPHFDKEVQMYKTSAIGPVFVVHHLVRAGLLKKGSKVILVSSECGSIGMRHELTGGGNYGHHGSKAALNMVGKLLSLDLKQKGIAVGVVHPGYMKTELTMELGTDAGAVKPDIAAQSLIDWIETFDISQTGEFWAPRGTDDIRGAEHVLGPKEQLQGPIQLPW